MIIFQLTYSASIWYTFTGEKRNQRNLVMQLVQAQAIETHLIIRVFKANSSQALNIKAHLTFINLELDKKTFQTAVCLFSGLLYQTVTQSRSIYVSQTSTPLENFEKCYIKLVNNSIEELEKRPAYIMLF